MAAMVSIIVPVYNAEKYLNKCVDSILNQDYKDLELILIDDGSKDSSGQICDAYAAADARVRVFHKENSGVSATRNLGLSEARGNYIQFLDSDDWITADATASLVKRATESDCDLVIADFYRVSGDRAAHKGNIDTDEVLSREAFASIMMENPSDFYYGVLWNKLYKRSIIADNDLRMDPKVNWCEDFLFNLEYIRYCKSVCALQTPIYYYVKRKGSLVSQNINIAKTIRMKTMVFEYYQEFYKDIFSEEEFKKNKSRMYKFLVDVAGDSMAEPTILPNSFKLGHERITIDPEIEAGSGVYAELFRKKILFEQKLESAALKNNLTPVEASVLYTIWRMPELHTHKQLQEVTGCNAAAVYTALLHLSSAGYIFAKSIERSIEKENEEKNVSEKVNQWVVLSAADGILKDFADAEEAYAKVAQNM